MNQSYPVIRYTGLSAYVEAYARGAYAYPVFSLFGAKTSVQAIAAALVSRMAEVFLSDGKETREVSLTVGEYKIFTKSLPCGACHTVVINASALINHCALPYFFLFGRDGEEPLRSSYFWFLDRLAPIPLLPGWTDWLWQRGVEAGEIEPLEGYRLAAFECRVDLDLLKKDLARAVRKRQLKFACTEHRTILSPPEADSIRGKGAST